MAAKSRMGLILGFALRFIVIAPVCLVLWWLIMPYYARLLGQAVLGILGSLSDIPVNAVGVEREGVLNTGSRLVFSGQGWSRGIAIGQLVSNIAPYIALVLSTAGLPLRKRLLVLLGGILILASCHGLFLVLAFLGASVIRERPEIPTALGQLFITMPFLLWIILVYWGRIMEAAAPTPAPPDKAPADPPPGDKKPGPPHDGGDHGPKDAGSGPPSGSNNSQKS